MLLDSLLIYITIPLTAIFIRVTLQKWGVTRKMLSSKYKPINNLGFCELCFYTWCNFFTTLVFCLATKNYSFILYIPAFTIISIIVSFYLGVFDNEE